MVDDIHFKQVLFQDELVLSTSSTEENIVNECYTPSIGKQMELHFLSKYLLFHLVSTNLHSQGPIWGTERVHLLFLLLY